MRRGITSDIWRRAASKVIYRPTSIDSAGSGDEAFSPWRNDRGEFLGYVTHDHPRVESIVVFFHGKDGEALEGRWFAPVVSPGQALVLAEYPGYGARSGSPSEEVIFNSALEIIDAVESRWGLPIVMAGESLGTSVACYAASRCEVARVALVSPFSSFSDIIAHRFSFLPKPITFPDNFSSKDYVGLIKAPLHVVHGAADRVVPIALSHRLLGSYQGPAKHFTKISGVGHVTVRRSILESDDAELFRQFVKGPALARKPGRKADQD